MAGWNVDRSDVVRMLREQASRVYIQTIAANEREDRILHRKLDALDLEHRAQYLKMKKVIQDARVNRKKRLLKLRSNVSYANEASESTKRQLSGSTAIDHVLKRDLTQDEGTVTASEVLPSPPVENIEKEAAVSEPAAAPQKSTRGLSALNNRVKYTESEVAHLKASFAGQRTPPTIRRRTFLPHLQEASAAPISNGKRKRRMRRKGKEKGKEMEIVGEKFNELNMEASKLGNEKLPKIHADNSKSYTKTII